MLMHYEVAMMYLYLVIYVQHPYRERPGRGDDKDWESGARNDRELPDWALFTWLLSLSFQFLSL